MKALLKIAFWTTVIQTLATANTLDISAEKVAEYELQEANLDIQYDLSNHQIARVFREIESTNNYYAKTRRSSAEGAYAFLSGTRNMLFRKVRGVNRYNWRKKANQDKLFHYYYGMQKAEIVATTRHSISKAYMSWQMGITGFKRELNVYTGKARMSTSVLKAIKRNMPNHEMRKFEVYTYAKMELIADEYGLELPNYNNKTSSIWNFKRYFEKRLPKDLYDDVIDELTDALYKELVNRHISRYVNKIDTLVNTLF